jgi:hypothetical protein
MVAVIPRIETVELGCEVAGCETYDFIYAGSGDVDIADFLRGAIYRGWRLIEPDASRVTAWPDGRVEIQMSGLCEKCARVVRRSMPVVKNALGADPNARK